MSSHHQQQGQQDSFSLSDDTFHRQNLSEGQSRHASSTAIAAPPGVSSSPGDVDTPKEASPFTACAHSWTRFTQWLHFGISQMVLTLSLKAARNPRPTIGLVLVISLSLLITGFFTNFNLTVSEEEMFAPINARSRQHASALRDIEGFPKGKRGTTMLIHKQGDNVMGYEGMSRMFQALDALRNQEGYDEICATSDFIETKSGKPNCRINGPTRWWYDNTAAFHEHTQGSDKLTIMTLSNDTFPGGTPLAPEFMMGHLQRDNNTGLVTYAESLAMSVELPYVDGSILTPDFELDAIDRLNALRKEWEREEDNAFRLEHFTIRSVPDELARAIANDIPLVPFVFLIMTLFTCSIFWRKDRIQSRTLLGVGSVVTIVMSIMSGYGLAFIIGIPFTSMTQILPFVVFGVGLDDTFIITGAYFRTDPNKDTIERIRETMEEVGNSISLTTLTTTVAFCLGCISTIPSIRWLCMYAFPTIFIDFIYQITFFIAIVVLDEERIKANRRDCCVCIVVQDDDKDTVTSEKRGRLKTEDDVDSDESTVIKQRHQAPRRSPSDHDDDSLKKHVPVADRFMDWYANKLLQPAVKICVLVAFTVFLAGCSYSASKLTQEFKAADFLPDDSYATDFLDSMELYMPSIVRFPAYFLFVDQSDPEVQDQMISFIEDLKALDQFGKDPEFCWVTDFRKLKNGEIEAYSDYSWVFNSNMTFNEQMLFILSIPEVKEIYERDIAIDEDGNIEASRCWMTVTDLDMNVVLEQIDIFNDIQDVIENHPVNQARDDFPFFTHDALFFIWEFYKLAADELVLTTITGVVAITGISFLLIPHWTATFFVTPLICVLYADLLGTIQFSGLHINPLSYVCLVISIGLLVDFLLHILLKYYESTKSTREEKVKDTLRTMGASILVGGLSTCLGVIPLAFSASGIFKTVFICFMAMISLGIGHGLILLPVLLSYFGPEVCVRLNHAELAARLRQEDNQKNTEHPNNTNRSCSEDVDDIDVGISVQKTSSSSVPSFDSLEQPPSTQLLMLQASRSIDVDNFADYPSTLPSRSHIDASDLVPASPHPSLEHDARTPVASNSSGLVEPRDANISRNLDSLEEPHTLIDQLGLYRQTSSGSIEV